MNKKAPLIAVAALALGGLSFHFGRCAAPRLIHMMIDMPLGESLINQPFNINLPYKTSDTVILIVQPELQSIQEMVFKNGSGDSLDFKAARPGSAAVWRDVLLDRGHFRYYTEGNEVGMYTKSYAPGTLSLRQYKEHGRLMAIYASVVAAEPKAIPSDEPLNCEKRVGETFMHCNRF